MPRLLSTLLIAALLSACASKPDEAPERTEAEQYREARESMESNNYVTAVDRLKELEARGMVLRTVINDRPIAVTYELTELGRSALDILEDLRLWSEKYDIR